MAIIFLVCAGALAALGLLMVYSASFPLALGGESGDAPRYLRKQATALIFGLIGFAFCYRLNMKTVRRWVFPLALLSLAFLGFVLLFGEEVNGAKRWLNLGYFKFQPSELAKLAVVAACAAWLAENSPAQMPLRSMMPPLLGGLVMAGLIVAEPNLSTALLVFLIILMMFYLAGARLRLLLAPAVVLLAVGLLAALLIPGRWERIKCSINPDSCAQGGSYQVNHSRLAVGLGGWFGRGIGESTQKYRYLPLPHTDSVFAVLGEELGFAGCAAVALLFGGLLLSGLSIAHEAPDNFSSLLAAGLTGGICLQALLNFGVTVGPLPTTGIPLPFLSYGGSSLLATLCGLGLVMNVYRTTASQGLRWPR
jgi:cell division protein FtsW